MIELVAVFMAGLLAGEEFVVRYGVHPAIAALDERSQIQARQLLIRRLRVLVPAILGPTIVAALIQGGSLYWWVGVLALFVFVLVTFIGTVPINQAIGGWQPDAPPANWRAVVRRWARLDLVRSTAAILAFLLLLITAGGR